jgi:GAF domain-containing protein
MTSLLGARIIGRGTVFGNIYLTDKQDADMFDEEDERVLVVLATSRDRGRTRPTRDRTRAGTSETAGADERERIEGAHDGVIHRSSRSG